MKYLRQNKKEKTNITSDHLYRCRYICDLLIKPYIYSAYTEYIRFFTLV